MEVQEACCREEIKVCMLGPRGLSASIPLFHHSFLMFGMQRMDLKWDICISFIWWAQARDGARPRQAMWVSWTCNACDKQRNETLEYRLARTSKCLQQIRWRPRSFTVKAEGNCSWWISDSWDRGQRGKAGLIMDENEILTSFFSLTLMFLDCSIFEAACSVAVKLGRFLVERTVSLSIFRFL